MTDSAQLPTIHSDFSDHAAIPLGFRFAGVHAGIKTADLDLGLIAADGPVSVAGCVTLNQLRAPCVRRTEALVPSREIAAVVVNSGNANAMAGPEGLAADESMARHVAGALGCPSEAVLTASTGTIGIPLPADKVGSAMPQLMAALDSGHATVRAFATAILTTDTGAKYAHAECELPEAGSVRVLGIAKGSGMIHPNMATTLAYVCTDAEIEPQLWQAIVARGVELHFNRISVDGDMSTNDMLIGLASGASGVAITEAELSRFAPVVEAVVSELADQIVIDGEGATHMVTIDVEGCGDEREALQLARGIARSPLFKCGVFAGSPWAWGRLAAAAGQAAAEAGFGLDEAQIDISAQGEDLVTGGTPCADADLRSVAQALEQSHVRWRLVVGKGPGSASVRTCDLTYEYVRINADEARQLAADTQDDQSAAPTTLDSSSPTQRHQLLVDALGYARRFSGMRVMIRPSGSVLERGTLCQAFARDVDLVVEAAMRPVIVCDPSHDLAALQACLSDLAHRFSRVDDDPATAAANLDSGQPVLLVLERSSDELARLAVELGCGKLLIVGDDAGLQDTGGIVTAMTAYSARSALACGALDCDRPEHLELIARCIERGVPAVHLIDGRIQHALVGELFTDDGVGSLISTQISDTPRTQA